MKIIKTHTVLVVWFLIHLFSCNNPDINFQDGLPDQKNNIRTVEDVKTDFQSINFQPGVNDITLETHTKGVFWNFRVIVPNKASELNKMPLIINLHGGAQNNWPDAHKATDCLISPALDGLLDAYIISPNSNANLWYEQNNQIQILALLDLATSYLHIDKTKIAITGYSDGGNGSWFYAQYYSSLFSAAIPIASSYNTAKSNGNIDKIEIPLYVIHGEDDLLFPLNITQGYVNASIEAGSNIEFVIATGLDHYQACDYTPYLREAISWLNSEWD